MSSTPSRRTILAGAAAFAAATLAPVAAAAAAPGQVSPKLLTLIEAHKRASADFNRTCEGADASSPKYTGEEGKRRWEAASDLEEVCLAEIVAYPSQGPVDDRAKGEYFRDMDGDFRDYDDAIIDRLLNA